MRLDAEHRTPRLHFAVPAPRHFDAWAAAHAAAAPPKTPFDPPPRPPERRTRADFDALLATLTDRRAGLSPTWFAFEDDALVGGGTIFDVQLGDAWSAHLGYHVFNHRTGRGLGGELVGGLVALGFGALGLHRLEACVEPENAASIAVLGRVGFRREGRALGRVLARGAWRDVEVFALTCEERGYTWAAPD